MVTTPTFKNGLVDYLVYSGIRAHRAGTSEGGGLRVHVSDIRYAPVGHPLVHPRQHLPRDPDMVEDIRRNGVQDAVTCYVELTGELIPGSKHYKRVLYMVDGSQRLNCALAATDAGTDRYLRVNVVESIAEALFIRLLRNGHARSKRPDTVRPIAVTVRELTCLGIPVAEVAAKTGINVKNVEALSRFHLLSAGIQDRLDATGNVDMVHYLLDVPEPMRAAKLDELLVLAEGVRSGKGLTRRVNAAQRAEEGATERPSARRLAKVVAALESSEDYEARTIVRALKYALGLGPFEGFSAATQELAAKALKK